MPTTTLLPSKSFSAGLAASTASESASCCGSEVRREVAVLALERRLEHVHRRAADEPADEEVHRLVVQLLRLRDLLKLALAHDRDAVAHRHRLDLVVRDVDRRHAEVVLELADLGAHLDAQLRVEVRERLVHEEGGRLAHDRAPHRDALPLTAGERARLALQERIEIQDARRLVNAPVDLVLRHLLDLQAERDVLVDGKVRVERVALEDHRDVAVAGRDVVDDTFADPDDAARDVLEPRDHAQRGRLAAARRPDEHHELAVVDVELKLVDGSRPVGVDLADPLERDCGHRSSSDAKNVAFW